jgi:aarF domain-containing kinase
MCVRIGKVLLYGSGLATGGALLYTAHKSGYDPNNIGYIRFGRAALTVGRIGLDYRKSLFSSTYEDPSQYEAAKKECHQRSADRLLKLCSVNGGVFIKVGQHIGALDYLLPDEYVQTMRVLHHDAPSMPLQDIYEVLREELGKEPSELFDNFEEEPLGTASLAQVHRATMKNGNVVAVKVQHKFVKKHSFVASSRWTSSCAASSSSSRSSSSCGWPRR